MKNYVSLGNISLCIDNGESSGKYGVIDGCIPPFGPWFPYIPILIEIFLKGQTLAMDAPDKVSGYSTKELHKHMTNDVLPKVVQSRSDKEVDETLSRVYTAYPQLKSEISKIRDEYPGDDQGGSGIQACPVVPLILAGMAIGWLAREVWHMHSGN